VFVDKWFICSVHIWSNEMFIPLMLVACVLS
jgi:hypothetical protein